MNILLIVSLIFGEKLISTSWISYYEPFGEVPLEIKANVVAFYEPPQKSAENSVSFEADPNEEILDGLRVALGVKRVGWMFTDLLSV
uniref:Nuclear pore localisation protein NPL4 C-terminal domain-containing protein n=1 Tax=Panagrolaimus davidi TaxID=227884 RepID=A0A914QUW7_9BILA